MFERGDRVRAASDRLQNDGAVEDGGRKILALGQDLVERGERLEVVTGLMLRDRVVGAHVGVRRVDRQRTRVVLMRLVELLRVELHVAERDERGEILRVARQPLAQLLQHLHHRRRRRGRPIRRRPVRPGARSLFVIGPVPVCGTVNVPGGSVAIGAGVAAIRASPCSCGSPLGPNAAPVVPNPMRKKSAHHAQEEHGEHSQDRNRDARRQAHPSIYAIGDEVHARRVSRGCDGGLSFVCGEDVSRASRPPRRRRTAVAVRAVQHDVFRRRDPDLPDRVQRALLEPRRAHHLQAAADRALAQAPGRQGATTCARHCCTR